MGLDGVELVMAVEDAFDIQIDDSAAAKLLTPRLLIDYVMGKVTTATASVCLTQRAFNLLRKSLIRHCGLKRSQVRITTDLSVIFPPKKRRELLQKITTELAIKRPPELERPGWVNAALLIGSLGAGIASGIATFHFNPSLCVWFGIFAALVMAGLGIRLTKRLCREFPEGLKTIGDLARWVMTHKGDLANTTPSGWTREQITIRVRELIVEQLGVKPDFSEDARFVEDLGLD